MKASEETSPAWMQKALNKLAEIEEHASEYEDEEEGDKAPTPDLFQAVRAFLESLKKKSQHPLEEPHFFVSPNGNIVVIFSNKKYSLDIRFTPKIHFYFKDNKNAPQEGSSMLDAIEMVCKNFKAET